MSYLDSLPRPAENAFQPVHCVACGVIVGIRAGGGTTTSDGADEDIEARFEVHMEFHARIDSIERHLDELLYGKPLMGPDEGMPESLLRDGLITAQVLQLGLDCVNEVWAAHLADTEEPGPGYWEAGDY